jgi:formylmethanofuran dehydrogenase subunit E
MEQLKKIDKGLPETMICGRSLDVFLDDIERFHGFIAPGLVLGGFMVDWAQQLIGPDVEADAVVETCHCLPDAVQIFTPCTIGNGWLKVLDWDKFAVTLYDKRKLNGYRIWLDLRKTFLVPRIYNWYMRRVPKKDLPLEALLDEILSAQRSVLSCRAVQITAMYGRKKKRNIGVCSICGEAYSNAGGDRCITCQGGGYYSI